MPKPSIPNAAARMAALSWSPEARAKRAKRPGGNGGRLSNAPRCWCGLTTQKQARKRGHRCGPEKCARCDEAGAWAAARCANSTRPPLSIPRPLLYHRSRRALHRLRDIV
jgi:hypothetical protein